MPHIRLVQNDDGEHGGIYINGTLVISDDYMSAQTLIEVLHDNLGYDAKTYSYDVEELADLMEHHDDELPTKLRDFGDLVTSEDRI